MNGVAPCSPLSQCAWHLRNAKASGLLAAYEEELEDFNAEENIVNFFEQLFRNHFDSSHRLARETTEQLFHLLDSRADCETTETVQRPQPRMHKACELKPTA